MKEEEEVFDPADLALGHEVGDEEDEILRDADDAAEGARAEDPPEGPPAEVPDPADQAEQGRRGDLAQTDYEHLVMDAESTGFDTMLKRLAARPREVKLVLLLGYPTAGKTWFLQRLKWIHTNKKLSFKNRKVVLPKPVWEGHSVERTDYTGTHLFDMQPIDWRNEPDPKRPRRTFLIADLPGELFDRTQIAGDSVHVYERDEVTSLLEIADALIMMLPAEEVLSRSVEPAADNQNPTERLPELQSKMAAAVQAAKAKRLPKAEKAARLKAAEAAERDYASMALLRLKQHMQDFVKLGALVKADPKRREKPLPIFVALSRADQIVSNETPYDKDPWDSLFAVQPELADHLQKDYLWSRVDFVTAFEGQVRDDTTVRYEQHRHFGVDAVLEWIDWATERTLPGEGLSWLGLTRVLRLRRQDWANQIRSRGDV